MSKITSISEGRKKLQAYDMSPDEQIEELSKSFKKHASSTSRSDKKKDFIKKIKEILRTKKIPFRASSPKDWVGKKHRLAIFFPEEKIFFTLENESSSCRDDWSCYRLDESVGADFSALKIINSIGDLYNGRTQKQTSIKPDK